MNAEELTSLRAAAERIVTTTSRMDLISAYSMKNPGLILGLARAFIAAHPADSAAPIDAAWLEAILEKGESQHALPNWYCRNEHRLFSAVLKDGVLHLGVIGNGTWGIAQCKTRGDLLRLMAALNIPPSAGAKGE